MVSEKGRMSPPNRFGSEESKKTGTDRKTNGTCHRQTSLFTGRL